VMGGTYSAYGANLGQKTTQERRCRREVHKWKYNIKLSLTEIGTVFGNDRKIRFNSGNTYYLSRQGHLSSSLLCKILKF
jgi:hypothetical protein